MPGDTKEVWGQGPGARASLVGAPDALMMEMCHWGEARWECSMQWERLGRLTQQRGWDSLWEDDGKRT